MTTKRNNFELFCSHYCIIGTIITKNQISKFTTREQGGALPM
jgi:hypothetical protein